jgi:hypothetical protein
MLPPLLLLVSITAATQPPCSLPAHHPHHNTHHNAAAAAAAVKFHVCAASGNDDRNTGLTAEEPLRTLPAARDAARRFRAAAAAAGTSGAVSVCIVLHAGAAHHLTQPLVLDARDSHTHFVGATSGGGGKVLVSGGLRLSASAVSPRPGHARQFQANLTALGLADLGTVLPVQPKPKGAISHEFTGALPPQLFMGRHMGMLARWPNARNQTSWRWAYTNTCLSNPPCNGSCSCSSADVVGFSWRTSETNGSGVPPAIAHNWGAQADPFLHGYWKADWLDGYLPLTGVDAARHGLLVGRRGAAAAPLHKVNLGSRYLVFNLLSELDNDCEYFISRSGASKGMLYFQPPAGTWPSQDDDIDDVAHDIEARAFVSSARHLVMLRSGAEYLTFSGISFQHARSTVITSAGATVSHITITGCTVANSGGAGVELIGFHNTVRDSEVFNLGGTGIALKGGLHRSLTRGDNLVTRNDIHHYAQWVRTYQPGILWAGVGNIYSFNHIHDAPHVGILGGGNEAVCIGSANGTETTIREEMCGGNDNLFDSNEITHTNYECDDSGAIGPPLSF